MLLISTCWYLMNKFSALVEEERLLALESVLTTESDEEKHSDDEIYEENDNLCKELNHLIAESEQKRENWEKTKMHTSEDASLDDAG